MKKRFMVIAIAALTLVCLTFAACLIQYDLAPPRGPWLVGGAPLNAPISGSATGYSGGIVHVTITLTDGIITDVSFDLSSQTASYAAGVYLILPGIIRRQNSFNFDVTAGATYTVNGIRQAAREAFLRAGVPPGDLSF